MNRVMHFEIPSDNPEASMKFFKEVFGWEFEQFRDWDYWIAKSGDYNAPGINGAIMKKRDPKQPVVNTIVVENLEETIKKIEAGGGKIVMETQKIPTIGLLSFFSDPDGNVHGILQPDHKEM